MGWDPGSRANLNRLRQEGVVAVRYVSHGCDVELEVLSNCLGKGSYKYTPYAESQSKTRRSARELFADVPISAARLTGKLKGNRALRTDYELVGTASLPVGSVFRRAELTGPPAECARATHVVSTVYVGGFAMVAGEESMLSAKAKVFGAGAGDEEGTSVENASCRVPLRIGLLPLADVLPSGSSGCPDGMALLPGGTFRMGERKDTVTVAGFCMDVNEVTVERFAACVRAGKCSGAHLGEVAFDQSFRPSGDCNYGVAGRENHPVNCVDWSQAAAFCRAQDERLPSEEEWEWAARGGPKGTTYPWGNGDPDEQLCWQGEGRSVRRSTCPVGSFHAGDGPFGIHDLAGNVLEWTNGANDAYTRVHRGGYWGSTDAAKVRAADRGYGPPTLRTAGIGFRCARSLP
jgi:hypothetical protein